MMVKWIIIATSSPTKPLPIRFSRLPRSRLFRLKLWRNLLKLPEEVVEETSDAFDLADEYIEEFNEGLFLIKLVWVSPSAGWRSPSCDGIRRGVRSPLPNEMKDLRSYSDGQSVRTSESTVLKLSELPKNESSSSSDESEILSPFSSDVSRSDDEFETRFIDVHSDLI